MLAAVCQHQRGAVVIEKAFQREIWRTSTSTSAGGRIPGSKDCSLIKQAQGLQGLLFPSALPGFPFLGAALTPSVVSKAERLRDSKVHLRERQNIGKKTLFPIVFALRFSFLCLLRTVTRAGFVVPTVGEAAALG